MSSEPPGDHLPEDQTSTAPSTGEGALTEEQQGSDDEDLSRERSRSLEDDRIGFEDCLGRKHSFPWVNAKTWKGLENLILAAFLNIDSIYPLVLGGHYDVCLPDGFPIEKRRWDQLMKPGMEVEMQLHDVSRNHKDVPPPSLPHETSSVIEDSQQAPIIIDIDLPPGDDDPEPRGNDHVRFGPEPEFEWVRKKERSRGDRTTPSQSRSRLFTETEVSDDETATSSTSSTSFVYSDGSSRQRRSTSTMKTHHAIFSVPSTTTHSGALLRRRALSFPRARARDLDKERKIHIHSARCYDRGDNARGSSSSRIQLSYSEPVTGATTPQVQRLSAEIPEIKSSTKRHWIHIQRAAMDFVEFEHLCLTEFGRLNHSLAAVSGLLHRIKSEHGPIHGRYVDPGTVLRCDGGSKGNPKESAVFLSIPFLKTDKLTLYSQKALKQNTSHPSRPLYQALSHFDSTVERDTDQIFLKYDGKREKKVLWVNHVWIMMMGSAFITYGSVPRDDLCGRLISFVKEEEADSQQGPSIEFQDYDGKLITVPVHQTKSFFHLKATIQEQIRSTRGVVESIDLVDEDLKSFTAETWLRLTKTHEPLRIRLHSREDELGRNTDDGTERDADERSNTLYEADIGFPNLPHHPEVPPFLSWNIQVPDQAVNRVLEIADVLDYIASSLDRSSQPQELIAGHLIGSDVYRHTQEASFVDLKTKIGLFSGLSRPTTVTGKVELVSPEVLKDATESLVVDVFQASRYFLDIFAPNVDHPVTQKICGAILSITTVVERYGREWETRSSAKELQYKGSGIAKSYSSSQQCVVCELPPGRRSSATFGILNASEIEGGCQECKSYMIYANEKEAMRHLRLRHVPPSIRDVPGSSALREFLVPVSSAWRLLKIGHLATILESCKERLLRLCKCANDIQSGLLSNGKFTTPLNRLPAPLILAFERFVLLLCSANYLVLYIDKVFTPSPFSRLTSLSVGSLNQSTAIVEYLARDAERYLHKAQADIVYALSTGKTLNEGNFFNEVGLNYVVGQVISNLLSNPVSMGMSSVQLYRRYLEKMTTEARRKPHKRQLHQIRTLADELEKLKGVNKWQTSVVSSYEAVSSPATYRKPPHSRRQEFPLEKGLLQSQSRTLEDHRRRFNEMLHECETLGQYILHATEIEKDDQSKAILAFTIVTIIFLPLSFVTSYLGMNTTFSDGTWDETQTLFWKISLPLTFALGLFCLLLAFWEKTTSWIKENMASMPAHGDDEKPLKIEEGKPPVKMSSKAGRRVTFASTDNFEPV